MTRLLRSHIPSLLRNLCEVRHSCPFAVLLLLLGLITSASATTVSFDYAISFGAVTPDGPAPFAIATFDDGDTPGTVTLTVDVATTVGEADMSELYFNLDPSLNPTRGRFKTVGNRTMALRGRRNSTIFPAATASEGHRTGFETSSSLIFSYQAASTDPAESNINILTGADAYRAGGDGLYDIFFDLPPRPGINAKRFNAGETLIYAISGIGSLVASDFNFVSAPAPGSGGAGPFLSVARFISTGPTGEGSDFVGALPEPTSIALLSLGLALAAGLRRRYESSRPARTPHSQRPV